MNKIFEQYIKENEQFTGDTPEKVYKVSYIKTPGKVGWSHVKVVSTKNPEMSIKEPIKPGEDLDTAKKRAETKLSYKMSKHEEFIQSALNAPRQKLDEQLTKADLELIDQAEANRKKELKRIVNEVQVELQKVALHASRLRKLIRNLPEGTEEALAANFGKAWEAFGKARELASYTKSVSPLDLALAMDLDRQNDDEPETMDFTNFAGAPMQEQVVQSIDADDIADIVVSEINDIFEELPEGSPLKNREVALAALEQIKNALPAMIQGLNVG
jgi:hypothetical protein